MLQGGNSADASAKPYGPDVPVSKKVVVVLGPGHARAFAAAGVFRALQDAGIEVGGVVGTGMGALFAALYAEAATLSQFEWWTMRLKTDVLLGSRFRRLVGSLNSGNELEVFLAATFGKKDIRQTRKPLAIGVFSQTQGRFILANQGPLTEAIRAAVAEPGVMTPGTWLGEPAISASLQQPYLVDVARDLGVGPVIVLDVLTDIEKVDDDGAREVGLVQNFLLARANGEKVLQTADVVIRPELNEVGFFDFDRRTTATFKGKAATQKQIDSIREALDKVQQ